MRTAKRRVLIVVIPASTYERTEDIIWLDKLAAAAAEEEEEDERSTCTDSDDAAAAAADAALDISLLSKEGAREPARITLI